ncbi:hypothetical protein Pst134EA_022786 [Puccinia striiformis f. sp. tritici]|uniref:hypothetical protein n=1 Tax=Puccinia striiformis f. sp. tritici TaxID=168172 RepID=UPI002007CF4D|nr:hypothetical protein Pst134EA_022786 [Puccinia striiformis f. sp. tritici]KAH9455315.1 hypothetical protein Pst134EA_022786 [Puccinia striiformis f. sp. tritici]
MTARPGMGCFTTNSWHNHPFEARNQPSSNEALFSSLVSGNIRKAAANSFKVKKRDRAYPVGIVVSSNSKAKLDMICFIPASRINHPFVAWNQLLLFSFLVRGHIRKVITNNFTAKTRERAYPAGIVVPGTSKVKLDRICFITDYWKNHPFGAWNQLPSSEVLQSFPVRGTIPKFFTGNFTAKTHETGISGRACVGSNIQTSVFG